MRFGYNARMVSDSSEVFKSLLLTSQSQQERKEVDDFYVLVNRTDGTYQCYYTKSELVERLNQLGKERFWSSLGGNGYFVVWGQFPYIEWTRPAEPKETVIVHDLN